MDVAMDADLPLPAPLPQPYLQVAFSPPAQELAGAHGLVSGQNHLSPTPLAWIQPSPLPNAAAGLHLPASRQVPPAHSPTSSNRRVPAPALTSHREAPAGLIPIPRPRSAGLLRAGPSAVFELRCDCEDSFDYGRYSSWTRCSS